MLQRHELAVLQRRELAVLQRRELAPLQLHVAIAIATKLMGELRRGDL